MVPRVLPGPGEAQRSSSAGGTGRLGTALGVMFDTCFTGKLLLWWSEGWAGVPGTYRRVFSCQAQPPSPAGRPCSSSARVGSIAAFTFKTAIAMCACPSQCLVFKQDNLWLGPSAVLLAGVGLPGGPRSTHTARETGLFFNSFYSFDCVFPRVFCKRCTPGHWRRAVAQARAPLQQQRVAAREAAPGLASPAGTVP